MACNIKVNSAMSTRFQLVEYFIPVLFIGKFHKDWIKITQDFWHSRASNSKVNSPILPKFELIGEFMLVQIICNFHKGPIKTKQAMLRIRSNMGRREIGIGTNGQVTSKSIVRSGRNSNSSENLCLFRLSANLIKIRIKLNRMWSGQGQIWCFSALKGK